MILVWLLVITFVSGLLAWIVSSWNRTTGRVVCFIGLALDAILLLYVWMSRYSSLAAGTNEGWILEYKAIWIAPFGISFHLAMDGLSLLLASLTVLLGVSSVACSWKEIDQQIGSFHFTLMAVLTGILGVFTSVDLFLFYFFWELMLIPMFFLILIWGHENRTYAAVKFFIFTQAGGLFMLLSIVALYWIGVNTAGLNTFDYTQLMGIAMAGHFLIIVGFFIAFAVKLPVVGVHMWLPDAYTKAPTAGSVILAGLLSKTGAYGIIRFILPMSGNIPSLLTPLAMVLAVAGIFYGALTAFGQSDVKRFVAYTSVSHLGFVLLGIFAGTQMAMQGAVVIMMAHGLTTGALFIITGALQERLATRDMTKIGGLWSALPRMGSMALLFALASLGLPGLANFIGEFLVLAGTFQTHPWFTAVAAFGFVVSVVYSVWIIYQVFYGPVDKAQRITDLRFGEMLNLSALAVALIWIGIFPQTILNTAKTALENIEIMQSTKISQSLQARKNTDMKMFEKNKLNDSAEIVR
jgi:NADH-quinone oxidoreductase subunit M